MQKCANFSARRPSIWKSYKAHSLNRKLSVRGRNVRTGEMNPAYWFALGEGSASEFKAVQKRITLNNEAWKISKQTPKAHPEIQYDVAWFILLLPTRCCDWICWGVEFVFYWKTRFRWSGTWVVYNLFLHSPNISFFTLSQSLVMAPMYHLWLATTFFANHVHSTVLKLLHGIQCWLGKVFCFHLSVLVVDILSRKIWKTRNSVSHE